MPCIWMYSFLFTIGLGIQVHCEVFTSTTHLIQMLGTEVQLTKILKTYLKEEYNRMDHVKKFLNIIESEVSRAKGREEKYFGNPINSYLFIKHLTIEWNHIKTMISPDLSKIVDKQLLFPSLEDHTGTVVSLLRLQDTYQLKTKELADGKIMSNFHSKKLTSHECYDIGRVAFSKGDFYHALIWMQEALDRFDQENNTVLLNKANILDNLAYATFQQGNVEHALTLTEELLLIDPRHVEAKKNKILYGYLIDNKTLVVKEQRTVDFNATNDTDTTGNSLEEFSTQFVSIKNKNFQVKNRRAGTNVELSSRQAFEKICRQQHAQLNQKRQATLFCRYRYNKHPYLIFRPVKEEQVLDEPAVFLFHDVVSDFDIEKIKALALPRLQRALIRNTATNNLTSAEFRISKSAWLRDEDSPIVARLSRLISAVTNLSMETAEEIQVVNYGIGGYYSPHVDFFHKWENPAYVRKTGNRIATWMTYLSDVEWGGATVFPLFGGYIMPKKGSTVFWYNLHASGEVDYRTLHAACPVLIGNKWVANKWIREYGQEFRRPCELEPTL